ncbi:MAG: replicative DNA helicase [bacterium]|nr:replicative DNA helicase [bacterium]
MATEGLVTTPDGGLIPPQSLDAERSVLGAMLLDEKAVALALDVLRDEAAFYSPAHRVIFSAIRTLFERKEPSDLVTVTSLLQSLGQIEKAGGAAYVAGLVSSVPTTANVEHYVKIVLDKWLARELIRTTQQVATACYRGEFSAEELIEDAEQRIFRLSELQERLGFISVKEMMTGVIEHLERIQDNTSGLTGLDTGFTKLNEMTTGLHGGELIVVAARPSMGKTAFALNIAEHVAVECNRGVAIFSMEMSAMQLAMRLLSSRARVDGQRLRRGGLTKQDWTALIQAGTALGKAEMYIDASPQLTPLELNARCRQLKAKNPNLSLIVVDYIQLMDARGRTIESRQQEIAYISRSLKALAVEMNLPVIAISQLNRESEKGGREKFARPQMSQLRESGAIEQDADVVILLFRPSYYSDDPKYQDRAEAIIAKQRNGPTGTVHLQFLDRFARFQDPPPGFMEAYDQEDFT